MYQCFSRPNVLHDVYLCREKNFKYECCRVTDNGCQISSINMTDPLTRSEALCTVPARSCTCIGQSRASWEMMYQESWPVWTDRKAAGTGSLRRRWENVKRRGFHRWTTEVDEHITFHSSQAEREISGYNRRRLTKTGKTSPGIFPFCPLVVNMYPVTSHSSCQGKADMRESLEPNVEQFRKEKSWLRVCRVGFCWYHRRVINSEVFLLG